MCVSFTRVYHAKESEAGGTGADGQEEESGEVGVPHFWMQCMLHHEALHDVVV